MGIMLFIIAAFFILSGIDAAQRTRAERRSRQSRTRGWGPRTIPRRRPRRTASGRPAWGVSGIQQGAASSARWWWE